MSKWDLPDYKHIPLEDPNNELRLLELYPGAKGLPLFGSLRTYRMEDAPPYVAISYCWGTFLANNEMFLWPTQGSKPELLVTGNGKIALKARKLGALEGEMFPYYPGLERHYNAEARRLHSFRITANVDSCLRSIFGTGGTATYIWIDSICIDQSNNQEKGHQVKNMDRIYKRSEYLHIWLGEQGENSDGAFDLIDIWSLVSVGTNVYECNKQFMLDYGYKAQHWIAFIRLLQRPWFRRRWIIQELVMSQRAGIFCGQRYADWQCFAAMVHGLLNNMHQCSGLRADLFANEHKSNNLFFRFETAVKHDIIKVIDLDTCATLVREGDPDVLKLDVLLKYFRGYECSNPKDRIYSLLSMASDVDEDWVPDYTDATTVSDLLLRTFEHIVASRNSLDVLSSTIRVPGDTAKPSWLPTWRGRRYEVRKSKDSLERSVVAIDVAELSSFQHYNASGRGASYFASGSTVPYTRIQVISEKSSHERLYTLTVEGREVDTVCYISNESSNMKSHMQNLAQHDTFRLSEEWLHMACCGRPEPCNTAEEEFCGVTAVQESKQLPENIWRLLVGNRHISRALGPLKVVTAPTHWGKLLSAAHFGDLSNDDKLLGLDQDREWYDITSAHSVVNKLRRFTTTRCSIGWIPFNAKSGDAICLINGCSVPMVLRPYTERFEDIGGEQAYEFIGECYVDGLMEGEFAKNMDRWNDEGRRSRKFLLV